MLVSGLAVSASSSVDQCDRIFSVVGDEDGEVGDDGWAGVPVTDGRVRDTIMLGDSFGKRRRRINERRGEMDA
jgi:hypothetical protein